MQGRSRRRSTAAMPKGTAEKHGHIVTVLFLSSVGSALMSISSRYLSRLLGSA